MDEIRIPPPDPMLDMDNSIIEKERKFTTRLIIFFGLVLIAVLSFMSYIWISSGQMTTSETVWSLGTAIAVVAILVIGSVWVAKAID